jgi:hypothetical protein
MTREAMCTAIPPTSPPAVLDLAGVETRPDLDPDLRELTTELRGGDGRAGGVERGQDPVAGRLDELAAGFADQPGGRLLVAVKDLPPPGVTHLPARSVDATMSVNGHRPRA